MSNTDRAKEQWNKQKSMGRRKFILVHGGLLWGGCVGLTYGTLTMFFNPNPIDYNVPGIIFRYVFYVIISVITGIFISNIIWNNNAKRFGYK
ncbi:MAG: hypothetical protein ACM3X7_07395 [Solirubrobacterales bacterium]